jgi:collagen type III alpha
MPRRGSAAGVYGPSSGLGRIMFNSATGGNSVVDVANYNGTGQTWRVHTFNSSSTLTIAAAVNPFTILLVGGGGAGSGFNPYHGAVGGGGGGGRVVQWDDMLTVGSISVTVGDVGGQSEFNGQTAPGGGGGGGVAGGGGAAGGSGGGGGGSHGTGGSGGAAVAGSPRAGYGNPGGNAPTGGMASQSGGSSTFDSLITGSVTRPGQGGGPGSNGSAGMFIVAYQVKVI